MRITETLPGMNAVRSALSRRPDDTLGQLLRYAIVGGIALVVDFGFLVGLTELAQVHYLISAAIGFVLGLATNYTLSVKWVFTRRSLDNRVAEATIFGAVGVVGLVFNELFIWVFTDLAGIHYAGSKAISAVLVFLWNFAARKYLLFR